MTPDFCIQPLAQRDREAFASLVIKYLAEIAPTVGQAVADRIAQCWRENGTTVFTFHGPKLFGFAIIRHLDDAVYEMKEFYIAQTHRRHGIGRRAATDVIRRHPGNWQLGIASGSDYARLFWMEALKTYQVASGPPLTPHQSGSLQFTVTETVT